MLKHNIQLKLKVNLNGVIEIQTYHIKFHLHILFTNYNSIYFCHFLSYLEYNLINLYLVKFTLFDSLQTYFNSILNILQC